MMTQIERYGDLAVFRVSARMLRANALSELQNALSEYDVGQRAALLDLSGVRTINFGGLAALAELHASRPQTGFFGARDGVADRLRRSELIESLRYFATKSAALTSPWGRRHRLAGRRAVLLAAGKGTRCRPLTLRYPKPMLPILGRPILHHQLDHLARFGVRDILTNPGYLGPQIHDYFGSGRGQNIRMTYLNEGAYRDGEWIDEPLGSASTLRRMQSALSCFDAPFFVFCGDALVDPDLAALMDAHQASGAEITIAAREVAECDVSKYGIIAATPCGTVTGFQEKPDPAEARSRLANIGVYVMSPGVLNAIGPAAGQDIARDLIPAVMAQGGKICVWSAGFDWRDIGTPLDFFRENIAALRAVPPGQTAFVGPGAARLTLIGKRRNFHGPIWVGEGVDIAPGAHITGPVVIGANTTIPARSSIRASVILPGTAIETGAIHCDQIISNDWSISGIYPAVPATEETALTTAQGPRTAPAPQDIAVTPALLRAG